MRVVRPTIHEQCFVTWKTQVDSIRKRGDHMAFMDSIKGLLKGRKKQVTSGVDQGTKVAHDKLPDQYDGQIDTASAKAKEAVEKLPD